METQQPQQRFRRRLRKNARFFVPSLPSFLESLARWVVPLNLGNGTEHESVYFNDPLLTLRPEEDRSCLRRRLDGVPPDAPALYTLFLPKHLRSRVAGHGDLVDVPTATNLLRRAFARDNLTPYCAVRFRRLRYGIPDVGVVTVDTEVKHYSLLEPGAPVEVGDEGHPRVHVELERKPEEGLRAALDAVPRLPTIAKRWMGYFYMQRQIKLKRVNELEGYEYEIKLDADHLDVDVKCLPFPVHRVYQNQCIRRYYDGYRVSFRIGRATMVRKGEVEFIDGVPRRLEQKQKELSSWTLPEAELEMRRIKRTYLLINPETQRTYNLCLDSCRGHAEDSMNQIEIEYTGTLNPSPTTSMRAAEKAVIADMLRIRDKLIERHGFRLTSATKRDWARKHGVA
jgi:hypothetical protein